MSNASSSGNITAAPGQDDIAVVNSVCVYLANIATRFSHVPMLNASNQFALYLEGKPDATPYEMANYLGATKENVDIMIQTFSGRTNMTEFFEFVQELTPVLPHGSNQSDIIPLFIFFSVLTTVVLTMRMYSSYALRGGIKWPDWIMLFGFLILEAMGGTAVAQALYTNNGAPFYDNSWLDFARGQAYYMAFNAGYPLAILGIKSSILLFYYQLPSSGSSRYMRPSCIITFIIIFGTAVSTFFGTIFECGRVDYWNAELTITCKINIRYLFLATGVLNLMTDFVIWGLPLPMVWKLTLASKEKFVACVTFGLGAVACIASGFRLAVINEELLRDEATESNFEINMWTMLELYLAVICACAPALRALIIRHAPKVLSSSKISTENSSNSGCTSFTTDQWRESKMSRDWSPLKFVPMKGSDGITVIQPIKESSREMSSPPHNNWERKDCV